MHRSFPITVAGHLAGAAVTHDDRFRFIAVDPRAEELDESLWPSVAAVERVVGHLLATGRLPPHPAPGASPTTEGAGA